MDRDLPTSRMTLRDLLVHVEKSCKHLIEQMHDTALPQLAEFQDLSRPIRRRSHYPTADYLQSALRTLAELDRETQTLSDTLQQELHDTRDRAMREKGEPLVKLAGNCCTLLLQAVELA